MRRAVIGLTLVLALTGCGRSGPSANSAGAPAGPASPPDVQVLASQPAKLDEVHHRCKAHTPDATPELCAKAAEATRLRFLEPSGAYAPAPVQPFANRTAAP